MLKEVFFIKDNENNYKLYVHIFPDKKLYIGITKQDVQRRWSNGKGYKGQQKVYNAINKFGWENIIHYVFYDNLDSYTAKKLEEKSIEYFNTIENGYNERKGGGLGSNEFSYYEYNGKLYTPSELLKFSNVDITSHDLTTRLNRGWSYDKTFNQEKSKKVFSYYYIDRYYTIDELYNMVKTDLTRQQFLKRLEWGWDIERALSQPMNTKKQPYKKRYEYNGNTYNIKELCEISNVEGVTIEILRDRIENKKWDIEKAITKPLVIRNKKYEYNGKMYTTKDLEKLSPCGVKANNIKDRLKAGWGIYEAINTPIRK